MREREEQLDYKSPEATMALVTVLAIIVAIVVLFVLFRNNFFNGGVSNLKQTAPGPRVVCVPDRRASEWRQIARIPVCLRCRPMLC